MKEFNLDEYLKNPSRKVVTRDGRNVKIYCTNFMFPHGCQPIVAEIEGDGSSVSFSKNGKFYNDYESSKNDLFFAPEKHEGWINLYSDSLHGRIFNSEEEAKSAVLVDDSYITTIKIEWEE